MNFLLLIIILNFQLHFASIFIQMFFLQVSFLLCLEYHLCLVIRLMNLLMLLFLLFQFQVELFLHEKVLFVFMPAYSPQSFPSVLYHILLCAFSKLQATFQWNHPFLLTLFPLHLFLYSFLYKLFLSLIPPFFSKLLFTLSFISLILL